MSVPNRTGGANSSSRGMLDMLKEQQRVNWQKEGNIAGKRTETRLWNDHIAPCKDFSFYFQMKCCHVLSRDDIILLILPGSFWLLH